MEHQEETLLKVEHLCQYFKMGPGRELKAVDDVSFDIKKGEVFGLVGESGCGKTTTGRSIIKLYDITSGNVYFEGQRICAGTRSYKEAIRAARTAYREKIAALNKQKAEEIAQGADKAQAEALNKKLRAEAEGQYRTSVLENRKLIASAKHDQKFCDKDHAEKVVAALKEEMKGAIAACTTDEERKKVEKDYKTRLRVAGHERIVNRIQMIFQDPIASLNPRMTVRDIIAEGLIIHGIKDKEYIDEKVYNILEKVGLVREHAGRYPHEFSGGQRQRIGIARSVIMEPELIIADEPVSALDVSIQAQVINLLNDLRSELGITVLFIAHDLSVVKYFSDRIGVMYFGKMVELAPSDELFAHPLHPYTRSLLSAIPLPDPQYEKQRQRITYNPLAEHDYSVEGPTMREITPGHFIYCNGAEFEKYKEELGL
ncbi:MAG: oligopeptide ABC transporter ATP-binding protein [Bacillota bacterium]|nr:MAG: oligopeptide ABC transporter ATP-binding protein [Bacillota bacterium]